MYFTLLTRRLSCPVLRCAALPSTSKSSFSSLQPHLVQFRLANDLVLRSTTLLWERVVWVRGGGSHSHSQAHHHEHAEGAKEAKQEWSGPGSPEEPLQPKRDPPSKIKMFLIASVISFAITSLAFSTFLVDNTATDSAIPPDAPHVDFPTFAAKYLHAGEVQKIAFLAGHDKAVATLYPGAIIDGKTAPSQVVVIDYGHPPAQFWADVRKEENGMGISLDQGVAIQLVSNVSGWRLIEFLLGLTILVWLLSHYGRLMRKRILMEQAKKKKDL